MQPSSTEQAATWQASNDASRLEVLVSQLSTLQPVPNMLAVKGGCEFRAACAWQTAGLAEAVDNPRTARGFARALGSPAGTDALEARMQAALARVLHRHPERDRSAKPLADARLQRLPVLVLPRRQFVQMIISERQRVRISHVAARPSLERGG